MAELNDCSPNAATAFHFLTGRGLSSVQAAGIVGNLQWESRLDPHNDVSDPRKDDPSARGRGIASWGPPRWQDLLTFTYARGFDPKSLEGQLEFLWHELEDQPGLGLRDLAGATTVENSTVIFQNRFEKCDPAQCHTDRRIALAHAALSCLSVRPPYASKPVGIVVASLGVLSLVAAAGYGAYRLLRL